MMVAPQRPSSSPNAPLVPEKDEPVEAMRRDEASGPETRLPAPRVATKMEKTRIVSDGSPCAIAVKPDQKAP